MTHSAHSTRVDLLLRLWSWKEVSWCPWDSSWEIVCVIQIAGSGPWQSWLHGVSNAWAHVWKPAYIWYSLSDIWALGDKSCRTCACMPFGRGVWSDVCHSRAGEIGTVRNGYSLLLFPIESWRHPRKLCGTRSKKSLAKYFCTQLVTLIFHYRRVWWKPKAWTDSIKERPYSKRQASWGHCTRQSWDNYWLYVSPDSRRVTPAVTALIHASLIPSRSYCFG